MKVLIVDDEPHIIDILEYMLSDYEIISAQNGKEAIEKYKEFNPDIVLMDIIMPLMDGIEATKEILKINPDAKILAQTAYARTMGRKIMKAGALEILEKPINVKQLIDTIEKYF